ncbi:glycoside hydrolase superfamily [Chaetomium sp. MPI-SDFR-AT-0129]|nr:glycoside hydrolase superfamily [Chaetomium sp. MPI-SDFR-AT-0129]
MALAVVRTAGADMDRNTAALDASATATPMPIIGYYEAWHDDSKCHQTSADDLPVDSLTHLNYAFAFIDPKSFKITTMDAATPARTFEDVASLKLKNPNLQLFVSLGGWSFSDNETATQPVFGNIARSSTNRRQFADNLLKFLNTYGYDGVDIDWEYPGAPDRGGKPDDTKNYVLLVETLRKRFDDSGRKLGITFTAPSSFWYLRWFDLPGMVKHVDWINIMSYDLHGVWDSNNPLGSFVRGHTNLTEINLTAELFWRVKIPPSKLALGFGFYGRAFTLSDPSCTKPGCPFSGGAKSGVCTGTSGYLAHYEIQDIIRKNKKRGLVPIHDKKAAVKYMTWDNDQWISYDDADTFKQKIKWADSIGFGGSLIWASDLDDYDFTAHKGLTGNTKLGSALSKNQTATPVVAEIDSSFGNNCYKEGNQFIQSCEMGFVKVGADRDGIDCGNIDESVCGRIICCPKTSGMTDCMWRGSGGDCNGQCHEGEVKLASSSWGGKPGESSPTGRCNRGDKAFCCKAAQYASLTENCRWTNSCGSNCNSDEGSVAYAYDQPGWGANVFCNGFHYCCKKDRPIPLRNCHWVGQGDCADNTCAKSEITLWTNDRGDSYSGCAWYRKKALCCTPNVDALEEDVCDYNPCNDDPDMCSDGLSDLWGTSRTNLVRRTCIDEDGLEYEYLEERAGAKPGLPRQINLKLLTRMLTWNSRPYPTGDKRNFLFRPGTGLATMWLKGGYNKASKVCTDPGLVFTKASDLARTGFQTEHLFEVQLPKKLLETAVSGVLPKIGQGVTPILKTARLAEDSLHAGWNKLYAPSVNLNKFYEVVKGVPSSYVAPSNTPADRLMTAIGD